MFINFNKIRYFIEQGEQQVFNFPKNDLEAAQDPATDPERLASILDHHLDYKKNDAKSDEILSHLAKNPSVNPNHLLSLGIKHDISENPIFNLMQLEDPALSMLDPIKVKSYFYGKSYNSDLIHSAIKHAVRINPKFADTYADHLFKGRQKDSFTPAIFTNDDYEFASQHPDFSVQQVLLRNGNTNVPAHILDRLVSSFNPGTGSDIHYINELLEHPSISDTHLKVLADKLSDSSSFTHFINSFLNRKRNIDKNQYSAASHHILDNYGTKLTTADLHKFLKAHVNSDPEISDKVLDAISNKNFAEDYKDFPLHLNNGIPIELSKTLLNIKDYYTPRIKNPSVNIAPPLVELGKKASDILLQKKKEFVASNKNNRR